MTTQVNVGRVPLLIDPGTGDLVGYQRPDGTHRAIGKPSLAPLVGAFYDNNHPATAAASGTLIGAANRVDMAPFTPQTDLVIDQIGVACSTGVASATVKVFIYTSDARGYPNQLLFESAPLDCATTGYKPATFSYQFDAGVRYWVGVRHSSTATLRTIAVGSTEALGLAGSNEANYFTVIRRTITYATALPANWGFLAGDLVANIAPYSIRMRAA